MRKFCPFAKGRECQYWNCSLWVDGRYKTRYYPGNSKRWQEFYIPEHCSLNNEQAEAARRLVNFHGGMDW